VWLILCFSIDLLEIKLFEEERLVNSRSIQVKFTWIAPPTRWVLSFEKSYLDKCDRASLLRLALFVCTLILKGLTVTSLRKETVPTKIYFFYKNTRLLHTVGVGYA